MIFRIFAIPYFAAEQYMGFISRVLNLKTEIAPKPFYQPVFIIGCMRSGTTLLQNILDEHPQLLKIGFEMNDIWSKIGGAKIKGVCEHKTAEDLNLAHAHNMTNYFSESIRESKKVIRHLQRLKNRWVQGSGGVFYDWENIIPVNKSPHLMNKIGYVHAMYPKAKFILIVRSIFGQSSSMKMHFDREHEKEGNLWLLPREYHACWSSIGKDELSAENRKMAYPKNFELIPKAWLRLNALALDQLEEIPDEQYMIISYENLVKDQYNVLKRLFKFLELKRKHAVKEEFIFKRSRKLVNNLSGNPLHGWQENLDIEEIEQIYRLIENRKEDYKAIMQSLVPSARAKWKVDIQMSEDVINWN